MTRRLGGTAVTLLTFACIAIYLSLMVLLAVTIDRRFFVNDGVAVVVWGILGLGLVGAGRGLARRP